MISEQVRVSIDGIIGAGKSTLIRSLKSDYVCFEEPVEKWTLLPYMYKNVDDYGTALQFQILLTQFDQYEQFKNISDLVIVERCPWTAKHIFAPFTLNEYSQKVYDDMYEKLAYDVHYFIHLKLDPETAFERIQQRGLFYERNITLDYLDKLYDSYERNLNMPNVFHVDASSNEVERNVRNILQKIRKSNK